MPGFRTAENLKYLNFYYKSLRNHTVTPGLRKSVNTLLLPPSQLIIPPFIP